MAINNKFVYFGEFSNFELKKSELLNEAIVFIADLNCIYTHGRFFYCSNNAFLESLKDYATLSFVTDKIEELIAGAPEALDTLKEIADKLGENDNSITEILTSIASNKESIEAINEALDTKLEKGNYVTYNVNGENRKIITLDNASLINSRSNNDELENKVEVNGRAISLILLNKWNVVDIGSPYTLTNINVPKGVRPTVLESGQSGPNANQIAYLSDIETLNNAIADEFSWAEF